MEVSNETSDMQTFDEIWPPVGNNGRPCANRTKVLDSLYGHKSNPVTM